MRQENLGTKPRWMPRQSDSQAAVRIQTQKELIVFSKGCLSNKRALLIALKRIVTDTALRCFFLPIEMLCNIILFSEALVFQWCLLAEVEGLLVLGVKPGGC